MATALGTTWAGRLSGDYDASNLESLPALFFEDILVGRHRRRPDVAVTPWLKTSHAGCQMKATGGRYLPCVSQLQQSKRTGTVH